MAETIATPRVYARARNRGRNSAFMAAGFACRINRFNKGSERMRYGLGLPPVTGLIRRSNFGGRCYVAGSRRASMRLISSSAIALAAAALATPAIAQMGSYSPAPTPPPETAAQPAQTQEQSKGPQIKLSSKAGKAIIDLQTAVKANDTASIPAKVAAAQAVAQTKDDRYAIGKLQLDAAVAAKNNAAAAAAADAIAASAYLDTGSVSGLYKQIGVTAYNEKQYDLAATLFQKAAALNPNDAETVKLVGLAQNMAGHKAEASATLAKAIQLSAASGKKPEEDLYKQASGIAYGAKAPGAIDLGRQWVAAYPSPSS